LNRNEMQKYLGMLGHELQDRGVTGEIVLAGGAVMLLVINNRETTKDIDAYFGQHPELIRSVAKEIAVREGLREDWLNDGVKGFFYGNPPQILWADYPGLKVYTVHPEYLFAMKAHSGRDSDRDDLMALIKHLKLKNAEEALNIVERYIPSKLLTVHTKYLIEDLFD